MSPSVFIARKEARELVFSLRGRAWLLALTTVLSGFSLLLIGNVELSLLDNAQVVYDMAGIVMGLGALLAVITGTDAIAGERERGSLLPLILTPVSRFGLLAGKIGGQVAVWAIMLVLSLPYLWAVGSTGQNLCGAITALITLGTPVVLGFGFLAMGLGARMTSAATSLMVSMAVLFLSASPVLFGPSLRQSAIGRGFDAANPFSATLNALDAVIIDSERLGSQTGHGIVVLLWLILTLWFARASVHNLFR